MIEYLLLTLAVSLAIQAAFFTVAAAFRTDKVTDLSYGLTFVALAFVLVRDRWQGPSPAAALALMVILWGVRLAAYLFVRILKIERDARFDGVRENFWKFAKFWFFQGVAVWLIMLPATLWFAMATAMPSWSIWMTVGTLMWAAGLIIETTADAQKFSARNRQTSPRWIDHGVWRYSRHPNYFGELLCWWGVFVFVAPALGLWMLVALVGPVAITGLLLFVTGIPTLEASAERRWGSDPEYRAYRLRTSRLIPWPPSRGNKK